MKRRGLLALGAAATAVLVLGGGAVALVQPALRNGRLTERGRIVMGAISQALLEGSLPSGTSAARRELEALLGRIETALHGLPAHAQAEFSQLLALLGTAGGRLALAGLRPDWHEASLPQRQGALQSMRVSPVALRQQSYQALHDLVASAYFSDPSTWSALGYPGPLKL